MINRRETVAGLFLTAFMAILVLTGCRAFEPEAVIVNTAPETFIIGAPIEHGGGYYRFHVFWYGSDSDGRVERFVWALTDTTVQDDDTTDDEEDLRFNPALNASTLEIGHWTTRTDSVFNFRIDQGVLPSYDMTLHMVAVDDFGDYDRTPARLHFFSNSLGNPQISFFRIDGPDTVPLALGTADTVGFGSPYTIFWAGSSPNIRGYSPEALAQVDTVPDYRPDIDEGLEVPMGDGLLGYKYQILGDLGGNCLPSLTDCWYPRRYDEASGDSFSVFSGDIQSLTFRNNDTDFGPFGSLLPSGAVNIEVNSIDVAGVEVAPFMRPFTFMVNYDPQTRILDYELDPFHTADQDTYPYYILLSDPTQAHHPFQSGDNIPDRSYVVVKALARDDPRDGKLDGNFKIGIGGFLQGTRHNFTGGTFSFSSESSALNTDPPWDASCDTCWYADTLGFLIGPRSEFTINMQSIDEHGRRDGSPASLDFTVGNPPCIQCIELLSSSSTTSDYNPDLACITGPGDLGHPCLADTAVFDVTSFSSNPGDLEFVQPTFMYVHKNTGYVVVDAVEEGYEDYYKIDANLFNMTMLLHGKDDPREAYELPLRRILGWQYQVDYECDPFNQIKDGGGNDDLKEPTWGQRTGYTGLDIDPTTGLWKLAIDVAVPTQLFFLGPDRFKQFYLGATLGITDPDTQDWVYERLIRQYGKGTVRTIALDQTQCGVSPVRPAKYNFFRKVRPSVAELSPGLTWRDCALSGQVQGIQLGMDLSGGTMASLDGVPVTKHFRIVVKTNQGDVECVSP